MRKQYEFVDRELTDRLNFFRSNGWLCSDIEKYQSRKLNFLKVPFVQDTLTFIRTTLNALLGNVLFPKLQMVATFCIADRWRCGISSTATMEFCCYSTIQPNRLLYRQLTGPDSNQNSVGLNLLTFANPRFLQS